MPRPDESPEPDRPDVEPTPDAIESIESVELEVAADALDRAHARTLRRAVLRKTLRHERARRHQQSVWSFLGTFGLIGWTVAIPALLGLGFGLFLDDVTDTETSFTITFLVLGTVVGCLAAWYWIKQESRPDDD